MRGLAWLLPGLLLGCAAGSPTAPTPEATVPVWSRHKIELTAEEIAGNPFEVRLDAVFTHASGTRLVLPGYYDGEDRFEVLFMPTRPGEWRYRTESPVPALDDRRGTLEAVEPEGRGFLGRDPDHPEKWRFADGPWIVPVALRVEFFSEPATAEEFRRMADAAADRGVHLLETRLLEEHGMWGGRHDWAFVGDWRAHRFDLEVWNRMEERMEALAARGMGGHIMFYSDDDGAPPWPGRSATEALLLRYAVARLAPYPAVLFNTGIDIAEYRSAEDIDWLGRRLEALDPYGHPMSSRRGGGSGDIAMAGRTFESWGDRTASMETILARSGASRFVWSMDDAWPEEVPSLPEKNHAPGDVRRAFWKLLVAGGGGGLVRGNGDGLPEPGFFSIHTLEADWTSGRWIRYVNRFLQEELGSDFADMEPVPDLVDGAGTPALADPDRNRIVSLYTGPDDRWDPRSGDVRLRLEGLDGRWRITWFDPRNGSRWDGGSVEGGSTRTLIPPGPEDWVLSLVRR